MSQKVQVMPPRGSSKGGRDIVLVYPKQIPESKTYTVTFKTDTGGRAYSSKADAQKVADNTVIVKLPPHGRKDKVRLSIFGDHPLHLPPADFEFIGVARMLLDQLPMPITAAQILGLMLLIKDDEVRSDCSMLDLELLGTISKSSEGLPSLTITDILEGTRLSARDDKENLLHICGEYGFLNLANHILDSPALFPSLSSDLNACNKRGRNPAEVALEFDDLELYELFVAHGSTPASGEASNSERRNTAAPPAPLSKKASSMTPNALFRQLGNRIRTSSTAEDSRTSNSPTTKRAGSYIDVQLSPGQSNSLGRSGSILSALSAVQDSTGATDEQDGDDGPNTDDGGASPATKRKVKTLGINPFRKNRGKAKESKSVELPIQDQIASTSHTDAPSATTPLSPTTSLQQDQLWTLMQKVEGYARVKLPYEPSAFDEGKLRMQIGDVLYITERDDSGIWSGILNKKQFGKFPMVYVAEISQQEAEQLLSDSGSTASGDSDAKPGNRLSGSILAQQPRPPAARPSIQQLPLPTAPGTVSPSHSSHSHMSSSAMRTGSLARNESFPVAPSRDEPTAMPAKFIPAMESDDEFEGLYTTVAPDEPEGREVQITGQDLEMNSDEDYDVVQEPAAPGVRSPPSHATTAALGADRSSRPVQLKNPPVGWKAAAPAPARTPISPPPGPAAALAAATAAVAQKSKKGTPPPPVAPPPAPEEEEEEEIPEQDKNFYQVLYQGDITKAYSPDRSVEMMDYIAIKPGECVNILCEPSGESWALVEKSGKIGRVYSNYYAPRPEHKPAHRAKPIHLSRRLKHIDCILPGDQIGVHVDNVTQDLVIFQVDKFEESIPEPTPEPFPIPDDLPPPPMVNAEPYDPELYEDMTGEQQSGQDAPAPVNPVSTFLTSRPPTMAPMHQKNKPLPANNGFPSPVAALKSPPTSKKPPGSPATKKPPPSTPKRFTPVSASNTIGGASPVMGSKISDLKAQLGKSPLTPLKPFGGSPATAPKTASPATAPKKTGFQRQY
ncbi:uncharacterized protein LOC135825054 [Sycon ciliatum]|uniref:uncharacterized protein LOC135825054 n=1 Tax=Sycon ciliatum TaxID=27933 RepID=UPI0031F60DA0